VGGEALPRTPDLGAPAPAFALPAAGGGFVTLPDLLLADRPVLLVFTSPDCRPCDGIAPRVARWRDELADQLTVAVVSRASADRPQPEPEVLLQREWEVARAYGAGQMPSGLLVGADGRIASALAVGDLSIDELVAAIAHPAPVTA
jgi:thiol-disulfide isomerase/thioredoxin